MSKLKKDGMAFIVKCPPQPLNVGLPVTLRAEHPLHDAWLCEGNIKPAPGRRAADGEVAYRLTWVKACWLSPIDGDLTDDEQVTGLWLPSPTKQTESEKV